MKKLFLLIAIAVFYNIANAHIMRCVPAVGGVSCWLSNSPCEKQPDGSGGCHCPGGCSDPDADCSCVEFATMGSGGSAIPYAGGNTVLEPLLSNNNDLSVKNIATGVITFVANIGSMVENQLFRFELNENSNTIIMKRMSITEDSNGNITSQILNSDINFPITL